MSLGPFRVGDIPVAAIAIDVSREDSLTPLAGFTEVTPTVIGPDGLPIEGFTGFIDGTDVVIEWPVEDPQVSVLTQPGIYIVQAALTGAGVQESISPRAFQVLAVTAGDELWATVGDVKAATGRDVSEEALTQAQIQIELYSRLTAVETYPANTTPTNDDQTIPVSARDYKWLKLAVAYQAAWLEVQPDLYDRNGITNISQDGASVQYTASGLSLAPLAKKALANLSWLGSRSVSIGNPRMSSAAYVEWLDDQHAWEPMR